MRMTPPSSSPPFSNNMLRKRSGGRGDAVSSGYRTALVTVRVPSGEITAVEHATDPAGVTRCG